MLVLSRKSGESIQIDSGIQIRVVSIGKGQVRLGISAPDHVRILRRELINRGSSVDVTEEETLWQQVEVES